MIRTSASVIVLMMFLLLPLAGQATESGPSNTVGFWKLDVHPGFTQFSFPLLPDDKSLNNVLGDQLTGSGTAQTSDQILRWDPTRGEFQVAWYNTLTSNWVGEFDEVTESESYWIYVQPDHPATQSVVTFGNVYDEPTYDMGSMVEGYNAVGTVWAEPAPVALSGLDEFVGGMYLFLSDLIMTYDAATGAFEYAWKDGADEWKGSLTTFEPLKGYWIYIPPGHTGFEWNQYPQPNPAGLDSQTPGQIYPKADRGHLPPPPIPVVKQVMDQKTGSTKTPSTANAAKGGGQ